MREGGSGLEAIFSLTPECACVVQHVCVSMRTSIKTRGLWRVGGTRGKMCGLAKVVVDDFRWVRVLANRVCVRG